MHTAFENHINLAGLTILGPIHSLRINQKVHFFQLIKSGKTPPGKKLHHYFVPEIYTVTTVVFVRYRCGAHLLNQTIKYTCNQSTHYTLSLPFNQNWIER